MTIIPEQLFRPKTVQIASFLYVIYGLLVPIRILMRSGPPTSLGAAFAWLLALIYFLILALGIYRGWRWARWWIIGITGLGLLAVPFVEFEIPAGLELGVFLLQLATAIAVPVLLLLPSSKPWFRPNNSFKPKPLRGSA